MKLVTSYRSYHLDPVSMRMMHMTTLPSIPVTLTSQIYTVVYRYAVQMYTAYRYTFSMYMDPDVHKVWSTQQLITLCPHYISQRSTFLFSNSRWALFPQIPDHNAEIVSVNALDAAENLEKGTWCHTQPICVTVNRWKRPHGHKLKKINYPDKFSIILRR